MDKSGGPALKTPTAGVTPAEEAQPEGIDMDKTKRIQAQVDEVKDVMKDNIATATQRGENLDSLQKKTGTHHSLNNANSLICHA